tara:strand:- start:149 stop:280 length:132 start_codon:yes stop_codon:yes gene_type:complete
MSEFGIDVFDVVQFILNKSKRIFMKVSSNIALLLMGMRDGCLF